TQNASDTATLIADMCQVIIGCMTEPETVMAFMRQINEVIIEFSRVQAELIGDALIMPGHIMLSNAGFSGMSISDDNLAVLSPDVNVRFNLPLDDEIGRAMGGVAIHSCGNWSHTMGLIRRHCPSCVAIDCAVDHEMDPNPNDPVVVRDAMAGTGIAVNVRMGPETDRMVETVRRLLHPDIKLIVHVVPRNPEEAERNYYTLDSMLAEYFAGTAAAERPQDGI
ncbi:MAG: hypothetical protein HQ546_10195, partial [Planctomycetes bacterium]|nr:hypothetical protein [Planctomycetota bacterium]